MTVEEMIEDKKALEYLAYQFGGGEIRHGCVELAKELKPKMFRQLIEDHFKGKPQDVQWGEKELFRGFYDRDYSMQYFNKYDVLTGICLIIRDTPSEKKNYFLCESCLA